MGTPARRPLKSRGSRWATHTAQRLANAGVRPNAISLMSIVFAAVGAACLVFSSPRVPAQRALLLVAAAACIQFRLICNLLDGLVAVEGGLKTKSGEVFNDLPDRISDPLLLVAAGYAIPSLSWGPALGWAAGLLAVMTAYVRLLGGSLGLAQNFAGPMAKQHRMAVLTAACLLATLEPWLGWNDVILAAALGIIVAGCVLTVARRLRRIVQEMEAR